MKRIKIGLVASLATLALLTSCDEKQAALDDLRDMAKELNERADELKPEDWEEMVATYATLDSLISVHEYTKEELEEIGRLQGECIGHFAKKSIKEVGEELDKAASKLKGVFKGFKEAVED